MISDDLLARLRADTPRCQDVMHFNNAGASLTPTPVYQAVIDHLALEQRLGGYEAASAADDHIQSFYRNFARLLNVRPDEIAYVENASRAWDMAFYAIPFAPGDRIITHASEYVSNYLAYLQLAKRTGIEIDLAPSDETGQVDVQGLEKLIGPKTKLIAITHVPTQGGMVNPAADVGKVARDHGLLYLLDACQSVGQMPVDVKAIGCHFLSGTGRKFLRGPRGTGFLFVSSDIINQLDPPFIDLRSATWTSDNDYEFAPGAIRFENWESYVAGRIGLARAVDYALDIGLDRIAERISLLASDLRQQLKDIPNVEVHDLGVQQCGLVTFSKKNEAATGLAQRLRNRRINISVSNASSARLDLVPRGLEAINRASVHYFNTHEEVDRLCKAVAQG